MSLNSLSRPSVWLSNANRMRNEYISGEGEDVVVISGMNWESELNREMTRTGRGDKLPTFTTFDVFMVDVEVVAMESGASKISISPDVARLNGLIRLFTYQISRNGRFM